MIVRKRRRLPDVFNDVGMPSCIDITGIQLLLLFAIQPENEEDLWEEGESKGRLDS